MKYIIKPIFIFLLLFSFSNVILAQKKTKTKMTSFDFEYQGKKYLIQKGTKIHLGMGSADDGSFNFIEYTKHISGSNWKEVNMEKSNSNKDAKVVGMRYYKMTDYLWLNIQVEKRGNYSIQLYEAIVKGEVLGIDGFFFEKDTKVEESQQVNSSNKLTHILKLKNGSEIKCKIIQFTPNESIKIETSDGSIFVYKADDILELISNETTSSSEQVTENTGGYRNFAMSGNFEEVKSKKDSTLNSFFNGVEISYFIPFASKLRKVKNAKYGGFGVKYIAGHRFNHYFLLGGVAGFNVFIGDQLSEPSFYVPYFGLAEKFSVLKDKKISPEIGLEHTIGSKIADRSLAIFSNDISLGLRLKMNKNLELRAGAGIKYQYIFTTYGETGLYGKLNFGISF